MNRKKILSWILRLFLLLILYFIIWISGTLVVTHLDPELPSEPGLLITELGILILAVLNTILIVALIVTSKLRGISLAFTLGIAYYGVFTFLTQIETWYFLSEINVPGELLFELFLMGLPIPLIFIPLAVFICGRWKARGSAIVDGNLGLSKKRADNKDFISSCYLCSNILVSRILYCVAKFSTKGVLWQPGSNRILLGAYL